jgi:hypothetical protein
LKYRQRGYQEEERGEDRERFKQRERRDPDLPGGRLAEKQRVLRNLRCHHCGSAIPLEQNARGDVLPIPVSAACGSCDAAVHACRNCVHFDPNAAFECRRKVRNSYRKGGANDCVEFEPKLAVEMTRDESKPEGSFGGVTADRAPKTQADARKAFDDLFK